ncbi:MAG: rRNA pseudouridine synthase [Roseburia sp.]|nr:rRNA pseudouridine synthase [Roseburia sp.]
MRLDKYLADLQLGTRSQVKTDIRKGRVSVNGTVVTQPDYRLDESRDTVAYAGAVLTYRKYRYYMMYKPAGVVTATRDYYDKTVLDLLPDALRTDLFPVGRLDKDTEGLLLLTNDGELAHCLLAPKKHVDKTYYAECSGTISQEDIERLSRGVDIGDDTPTQPATLRLLSRTQEQYRLEITVTEGRFHQIKRMIAAVGGTVTYLKRIAMGGVLLDETLAKGGYRELTAREEALLMPLKAAE